MCLFQMRSLLFIRVNYEQAYSIMMGVVICFLQLNLKNVVVVNHIAISAMIFSLFSLFS